MVKHHVTGLWHFLRSSSLSKFFFAFQSKTRDFLPFNPLLPYLILNCFHLTAGAATIYACGETNAIIECKMDNFQVSQLKFIQPRFFMSSLIFITNLTKTSKFNLNFLERNNKSSSVWKKLNQYLVKLDHQIRKTGQQKCYIRHMTKVQRVIICNILKINF